MAKKELQEYKCQVYNYVKYEILSRRHKAPEIRCVQGYCHRLSSSVSTEV